MNLDQNPTVDQLKDLLRPHDDRAGHHILWVTRGGDVRLTLVPKGRPPGVNEPELPDAQLRFATFPITYGYVGPEAADDDDWLPRLLGYLSGLWQRSKGRPEVVHFSEF